jgi:16S rRNA (guanine1516-N2)-methyltransferase
VKPKVAVLCENQELTNGAEKLAGDLDFEFVEEPTSGFDYFLAVTGDGIELRSNKKASAPVFVDFTAGTLDFRRRYGQKGGEAIMKAVGGGGQKIFDATAGLGSDTFVLAGHDCEVTAVEREPVIAVLVKDALRRGLADRRIENVCSRIDFRLGDAAAILKSVRPGAYDVIYLDPMFPEKKKSALPKKELRILQEFAGGPENEDDSLELFVLARQRAPRVVVKRPARAAPLAPGVSHAIKQSSVRFDVYLRK